MLSFARYTGHKHSQYKIDSCLNDEDTLIVSGSEDGKVYFWDLVTVSLLNCSTFCDQTWHGVYDREPVSYEKKLGCCYLTTGQDLINFVDLHDLFSGRLVLQANTAC